MPRISIDRNAIVANPNEPATGVAINVGAGFVDLMGRSEGVKMIIRFTPEELMHLGAQLVFSAGVASTISPEEVNNRVVVPGGRG